MAAQIINGKEIAAQILSEVKSEILKNKLNLKLAIIQIGEDEATNIYIKNKIKRADEVGIKTELHKYQNDITEEEVGNLIQKLNVDSSVTGFFIQTPIPSHLDLLKLVSKIDSKKDIDGMNPYNLGALLQGRSSVLVSATAEAVLKTLEYAYVCHTGLDPCHSGPDPESISLDPGLRRDDKVKDTAQPDISNPLMGKHAVIIGRSLILGKPLSALLLNKDCTVTLCHSKTKNLKEICKQADILVTGTGLSDFMKKDFVKEGVFVIDCGSPKAEVDFNNVIMRAGYITPVPGGIGPITIASLLKNCLKAHNLQQ
ncbi:hypothetical protein A2716_02235 [candidate division WWE3 bacterium RIFCSPHIGHO2_01_FULL_40_23]|uniref:Bifunctional protein FolD n=1 Tax=candidate division WWE3 bacterium RIFCSPLOWO2_01_FULL_41_18 TaxID=1802625 RepID=A0A1F4VF71_UNCKA|nr:MAG: hypothetical protein A2716_02235 [candidate division WWE3 bacterium RIFCSPHIGHO2_01_FULL_40_23]OGC55805.1 MAG: hypothetical protein A3A78_02085 [candidate division WWE3 bacterium RIFCSPLOWO2_01_FULL_41_18]